MPLSLLLALAVSCGVAAGVFLDPSWLWPARWLVAGSGVVAFSFAARGYGLFAALSLTVALAGSCALLASEAQYRARHPPLRQLLEAQFGGFAIESAATGRHERPIPIEGRLLADATLTDAGANLRVQVERVWIDACPEPAEGGVSLTVGGAMAALAASEWRAGRVILAPAMLRRPARYLNYGVADQEQLLARRGIALVGTVKSAALVSLVGHGSWIDETASAIRAAVRGALGRHTGIHDLQSAAIAVAILIGDRGSLDPHVEQRLQEAGTYHVIAISGGNIAIVAGLILALLWIGGIRDGWAAAAAIALLSAYAHVAGSGASVVRATTMAVIYLGLRVIDQRTAPRHAMAVTAAALLVLSPLAVADVGMWLTFGATIAIVAGLERLPRPASIWLRAPLGLFLASICVEIVLLPIGAYVFQRVTLAGLVVNLAAVPCMAVVQVAAMITAVLDAAGWDAAARAAGWLTHLGVRGLTGSAVLVDLAPWLTWRVPSPPIAVMAGYYAALAAGAVLPLTVGARRSAVALAAMLFVWMAVAPPALARRSGDGRLHLTLLDVGQGDSMLVTLPNGRTLLVDAGGVTLRGDFDIGDRVVGPALRARGIARLDYLAITHGDPDHIGGAASLVRDFAPLEVWDGVFVNAHQPMLALQQQAARRRSAWRRLQAGDRLDLGGAELRIHHPPLPDWERQQVRNNDSLVMELRFGRVSVLLTGDIGREVEQALIPTLDLLPVVVLKSPHHGSGTSSSAEFIEAIKPRIVVISCGRANPYGHPVAYVLSRYDAVGADVYRTDRDGQIDVTTDGVAVDIATFRGRRRAAR
ncbi:MAG TPA: DNA internalization-related competence protein ComEC/Rec2 [Vicinamibacterales bacterium]|nr:DNA internalization-related competence protein ComEC/Rec2 [Vicinamibacterales bacterium]